jgi:hypothetical protein
MACISETAPACKTQLVKRFSPPVVAVSPCYIFCHMAGRNSIYKGGRTNRTDLQQNGFIYPGWFGIQQPGNSRRRWLDKDLVKRQRPDHVKR